VVLLFLLVAVTITSVPPNPKTDESAKHARVLSAGAAAAPLTAPVVVQGSPGLLRVDPVNPRYFTVRNPSVMLWAGAVSAWRVQT